MPARRGRNGVPAIIGNPGDRIGMIYYSTWDMEGSLIRRGDRPPIVVGTTMGEVVPDRTTIGGRSPRSANLKQSSL